MLSTAAAGVRPKQGRRNNGRLARGHRGTRHATFGLPLIGTPAADRIEVSVLGAAGRTDDLPTTVAAGFGLELGRHGHGRSGDTTDGDASEGPAGRK